MDPKIFSDLVSNPGGGIVQTMACDLCLRFKVIQVN